MATYAELREDIADSIDDDTGEYTEQINKAILKAIRQYEREPFYFNETRDVTFTTVEGQEWYDEDDASDIPTLVRIHAVYSEDSQGQRTTLRRESAEELEILSDNSASTGEPYAWTYFAQKIRLYPIPDATEYTIRLQLGPYRLTALSADLDSNVWTTEAYDLIFESAKYHLAADTLKDVDLAMASLGRAKEQEDALKAETSRRKGTGRICPTQF